MGDEEKELLSRFSDLISKAILDENNIPYTNKTYSEDAHLFALGDSVTNVYIILSGSFKVFINGEDGREVIINTLVTGETIGELSAITNLPVSTNISANEISEVLIIKHKDFIHLLKTNSAIMFQLLQYLAIRTQKLTKKIVGFVLSDVFGRITNLLDDYALNSIVEGLSHQDIASEIGSSREMTSKTLSMLNYAGYIKTGRKKIEILKPLPKSIDEFQTNEN